MPEFVNDDDGFWRWLDDNPSGFVVNSHRSLAMRETPSRRTIKVAYLHRATCSTLTSGRSRGLSSTTGDTLKRCAGSVDVLAIWAYDTGRGRLRPCEVCVPPLPPAVTTERVDFQERATDTAGFMILRLSEDSMAIGFRVEADGDFDLVVSREDAGRLGDALRRATSDRT